LNPAVSAAMPSRKNKPKRNDVPAKIDAEVMREVRLLANYEDVEIAELISETLRPIIHDRLVRRQEAAVAAEHKAKKTKP